MTSIIRFVHISDLHYRSDWHEEIGDVVKAFLDDIRKHATEIESLYIIFSGDLVQSGDDAGLYEAFDKDFVLKLIEMGFKSENLIFVPGNHDVNQTEISKEILIHCGLRNQNLQEINVNKFLAQNPEFTAKKFSNYLNFVNKHSKIDWSAENLNGAGYTLENEVGIYVLNTAAFSLGGAKGSNGDELSDDGYLHIETREMSRWLNEKDRRFKILVMHHPVSWLHDAMQTRLNNIIADKFDIVLHGHIHNQSVSSYHSNNNGSVILSAPPLFTRRDGNLGYSFVELNSDKSIKVTYRAWSGKSNFVPGVTFSDNETGELNISLSNAAIIPPSKNQGNTASNPIGKILDGYFNDSIDYFQNGKQLWIEPDIGTFPENSNGDELADPISCVEFASDLETVVLRAPPQFGLSVLGAYFAKSSWINDKNNVPVLVNANEFGNHASVVRDHITTRSEVMISGGLPIGLIVVDNFLESDQTKVRQANEIAKEFPEAKLVFLSRCDANIFGENSLIQDLNFEFEVRYVWSLKRPQVRNLVRQFIDKLGGLDEDQTVDYLISHFNNLNIHRTAHNTITLLTILQSQVDASPVNRTEMIEKFLYLRFSKIQSIPRYSTLPDLKDSLYVIGYFVENLVENDKFEFSKDDFLRIAQEYCQKQYLDIEVDVLFSCLIESGVFAFRNGSYFFHFSYWLHFFIAHRMHQNPDFFKVILNGANYSRYPAVIEYFSGIDRRASGLVDDLANDLGNENTAYLTRSKLDKDFDPLSLLTWNPENSDVEDALKLVQDKVKDSNLPKDIKDAVADRTFDRSLPYDQTMKRYISDSSLYLCTQKMKAAARALRNSDHAEVEGRKKLFSEIMFALRSEMHLLAAAAPIISKMGYLNVEGLGYRLNKNFLRYEDEDERIVAILASIPYNMAIRYLDDIYSPKMAPIFYEYLDTSESEQDKAILVRFLIEKKPKKWDRIINKYVMNLDRDSFYLYILSRHITGNYKYGFNTPENRNKLRDLTGLIFSLHETKIKKPSAKTLGEFANKILGKP